MPGNRPGCIQFPDEMQDRDPAAPVGRLMQANGKFFGLVIGQDIGFHGIQTTKQASCVVLAAQGVADNVRHGGFGAVGNELDRVDEILALHAQHSEPVLRRQVGKVHMPWGCFPAGFEVRHGARHLRHGFLQG